MNIVTLGIKIFVVFALVIGAINLLPPGSQHPLPVEIGDSIALIFGYLYALNILLPVDTLFLVAGYAIAIKTFTKIVYPIVLWLLRQGQKAAGSA